MNRRNALSGLAGILAAGFAPAAMGSGVLMPVRKLVTLHRSDGIVFWSTSADSEVSGLWVRSGQEFVESALETFDNFDFTSDGSDPRVGLDPKLERAAREPIWQKLQLPKRSV